ncbi:MAG TPA: hypothetical protein VMZ91_06725 [Candidatus Paceibacterota bacterium]|nr:hypothetical protein [Candidatus Paceibacterota bacterium]
MKQSNKTAVMIITVMIIIAIIILIYYVKANGITDEKTIKCISEKAVLYVSKTCGHCATQKQILGEYLDYFEIIDCQDEIEKCKNNEILYVPTWIISGEKDTGVKTIAELKEITGC